MRKIFIILALILSSCSSMTPKDRKLQTNIVQAINEKSQNYSKCAKSSDLFGHFNEKRTRLVLFLEIEQNGKIQSFKLDERNYPEKFVQCIFTAIEVIQFPKFSDYEIIKIKQPFILTKKY